MECAREELECPVEFGVIAGLERIDEVQKSARTQDAPGLVEDALANRERQLVEEEDRVDSVEPRVAEVEDSGIPLNTIDSLETRKLPAGMSRAGWLRSMQVIFAFGKQRATACVALPAPESSSRKWSPRPS